MKITLGRKFGIALSVLITIFGLLLGSSTHRLAKDYICEEILRNNRQTVMNVQDYYLQNQLADMAKLIRYWSVHPNLVGVTDGLDAGAGDYSGIMGEWKGYLALNRNVSCVYFGSAADGRLRSMPEDLQLPADFDARGREWYRGALMKPEQVFWSRPYRDAGAGGDMILTVSKAVRGRHQILGVVAMDIKLRSFSRMLEGAYANQSGHLVVLDESGEVYAHPDEQLLVSNLAGQGWVRHVLDTAEGSGTYSEAGREYVYAFITMPETGWKLVGIRAVDYTELFGIVRTMATNTAIIAVSVMLLGAVLTHRIILKPLEAMMETIRLVSQGALNARSRVTSEDEIGEISEAFDTMLDRIYETNHQLEESVRQIEKGYITTVLSLANAIEANDLYTRGHCTRVSEYSHRLGLAAGFSDKALKDLEFASILHDIGKIGISDTIINKAGKLDEAEFERIRQHPAIGAEILKDVTFLDSCRTILLQHHERVDGKGYPAGLCGDAIDPAAKVLAIADSFDAMTSNRPYRKEPMSLEAALLELEKGKGTQFDAKLTELFIRLIQSPPPADPGPSPQRALTTAPI